MIVSSFAFNMFPVTRRCKSGKADFPLDTVLLKITTCLPTRHVSRIGGIACIESAQVSKIDRQVRTLTVMDDRVEAVHAHLLCTFATQV